MLKENREAALSPLPVVILSLELIFQRMLLASTALQVLTAVSVGVVVTRSWNCASISAQQNTTAHSTPQVRRAPVAEVHTDDYKKYLLTERRDVMLDGYEM